MKYVKNIADRVKAAQKRAGTFQVTTDSTMYKRLKLIFYLFLIYAFSFSFITIMNKLNYSEKFGDSYNYLNSIQLKSFYISTAAVVLWIAAYIFSLCKKDLVAFILTFVPGCAELVCKFYDMHNTGNFSQGLNNDYWPFHFIPIAGAIIFIGWAAFIRLREKHNFKQAYINMVNRIYEQYHSDDIKEDEWEEFLENYDPRAEEEKRRRAKKEQSKK